MQIIIAIEDWLSDSIPSPFFVSQVDHISELLNPSSELNKDTMVSYQLLHVPVLPQLSREVFCHPALAHPLS